MFLGLVTSSPKRPLQILQCKATLSTLSELSSAFSFLGRGMISSLASARHSESHTYISALGSDFCRLLFTSGDRILILDGKICLTGCCEAILSMRAQSREYSSSVVIPVDALCLQSQDQN